MNETMLTAYEQDVIRWSEEQAKFLLAGDFEHLDLTNLADEILSVGKQEIRECEKRVSSVLIGLLEYVYTQNQSDKPSLTYLDAKRQRVTRICKQTPSLNEIIQQDNFWLTAWGDAYIDACRLNHIDGDSLPDKMPWTRQEVLKNGWHPTISTN